MTEAELLQSIQRSVALGQMTEQEAQTKWLAWLMNNKSDGSEVPEYLKSGGVSNDIPPLQDVVNNRVDTMKMAPTPFIQDIATAPTQQLQQSPGQDAKDELANRDKLANETFLQQLMDPEALKRTGIAALKGPSQMINGIINGVPVLYGKVTGDKEMVDKNSQDFIDTNNIINQNFGTSDALTPLESLGENAITAFVPGGLGVKGAMLGVNYGVDQTVRELTDDKTSPYHTVYDRLGISGADEAPTITEGQALAGGLIAGLLASVVINPRAASLMKSMNLTGDAIKAANTPPKIGLISSFDRLAPEGLTTVEKASDAFMMQAVDEQKALSNILARAGVPDPAHTEKLITLNSGSAAKTRISGAMVSGQLNANGVTYKSTIPVSRIVDGANALDPKARTAIGMYINLLDMVDDAKIALAAGKEGNHAANISSKLAQAARIAEQFPQAAFFKNAYETAMSAMLDTLDGVAISKKEAEWLRANRRNYVPVDISPVDHNAPLMTRMRQAQKSGEGKPEDWFTMKRDSVGDYDVAMRTDPFVVLQNYTENALNLVMNNEVRKHIVDSLKNSKYGQDAIQEITETSKNVEANQHRIISYLEDGVTKQYFTMSETAGIAKFDPYAIKYPWLYLPKRAFEKTTTGVITAATGPFAAKSLMRDMFSAAVLKPAGVEGMVHPGNIAAAIPKQFWQVAKKEFADKIRAGVDSANSVIPNWLWDGQSRLVFADKISNQYVNSLYHMLNEGGGFDASVNKAHYQYAKSAMGELKRTVSESEFWQNPAFSNVVSKMGINGTKQVASWISNLYHSTMDAARYATAEKMVKQGFSYEDAAIQSKKIAGDTSRTGRVYNDRGHILPDAVDQGALNVANKSVGTVTQMTREGMPYYNPTVQGIRVFMDNFSKNPMGTMAKVGMYVQLPSLAAAGWNEALGPEYSDYAMNGRSADDVAKSIYIGLPWLPPEQGLEWQVQQEFMLFSAPFSQAMHQLIRGDNSGQMAASAIQVLKNIAYNSIDGSTPPAFKVGMNYFGFDSFGSASQSFHSGYEVQEDDKGFLPQNLENMARNLFGNLGRNALETMYILNNGDSPAEKFDEFLQNTYEKFVASTPIAQNVAGYKQANAKFSIPGQIAFEKKAAINELDRLFKKFYDEKTLNADGFRMPRQRGYKSEDNLPEDVTKMNVDPSDGSTVHPDLPFVNPGPTVGDAPTNPLFEAFGPLLLALAKNNDMGMSSLDDRLSVYDRYTKQLKNYNAGDRTALKEFQNELNNTTLQEQSSIDLKGMLDDFNIDLTKYSDRIKLINIIENEKTFIYQQKLELYSIVESEIDNALKYKGLLKDGQSFKIENDLDPYNSSPLGIDSETLKSVTSELVASPSTP